MRQESGTNFIFSRIRNTDFFWHCLMKIVLESGNTVFLLCPMTELNVLFILRNIVLAVLVCVLGLLNPTAACTPPSCGAVCGVCVRLLTLGVWQSLLLSWDVPTQHSTRVFSLARPPPRLLFAFVSSLKIRNLSCLQMLDDEECF